MERSRGREAITVDQVLEVRVVIPAVRDLAAWAEIKAAWDPVVLVEIKTVWAQTVRGQIQVEQAIAALARLMG